MPDHIYEQYLLTPQIVNESHFSTSNEQQREVKQSKRKVDADHWQRSGNVVVVFDSVCRISKPATPEDTDEDESHKTHKSPHDDDFDNQDFKSALPPVSFFSDSLYYTLHLNTPEADREGDVLPHHSKQRVTLIKGDIKTAHQFEVCKLRYRQEAAAQGQELDRDWEKTAAKGLEQVETDVQHGLNVSVTFDNCWDMPQVKITTTMVFAIEGLCKGKQIVDHDYCHINLKAEDFMKIRSITQTSQLDPKAYPNLDLCKIPKRFSATEVELRARGRDSKVGCGLHQFDQPDAYGPWFETARAIQGHLGQDHVVRILVFTPDAFGAAARLQPSISQAFKSGPRSVMRGSSLTLKIYSKEHMLSERFRPVTLVPARASFANMRHLINTDTTGALLQQEYDGLRSVPVYKLQARAGVYPGGCHQNLCTQMILLVDGRSIDLGHAPDEDTTRAKDATDRPLPHFKIDDKVRVRIHKLQQDDWAGTVVKNSPFADPSELTLLIRTRLDEEVDPPAHKQVDITSILSSCVWLDEDVNSSEAACKALNDVEPLAITIYQNADRQSVSRLHAAAQLLIDRLHELDIDRNAEHEQRKLDWHLSWTGLDPSSVTKRDIYKDIPHAILDACKTDSLGRFEQEEVFKYVRALPNGMGIISGLPGTGKSCLLVHLMRPFFKHFRMDKSQSKPQVLAISPVNHGVDSLASAFIKLLKQEFGRDNFVVVRPYISRTEEEIFRHTIKEFQELLGAESDLSGRGPLSGPHSEESRITAESIKYTSQVWKYLNEIQNRTTFSQDRRLTQAMIDLQCSLSYQVLRRCGIIGDIEPDPTDRSLSDERQLRTLYNKLIYGDDVDYNLVNKLIETICEKVLRTADVICSTAALAMDWRIRGFIKPTAIVVDEVTGIQNLFLVALDSFNPDRIAFLMAGDLRQSRQPPAAPPHHNHFGAQLAFPHFARLLYCGYPHAQLAEQSRFGQDINDALSTIFYSGRMLASGLHDKGPPEQQDGRERIKKSLGISTDFMEVRISGTAQEVIEPSKSRKNNKSAVAAMKLIERMCNESSGAYRPKDFLIVTPYLDQQNNILKLQSAITAEGACGKGFTPGEMSQVTISTIAALGGREHNIVIFDATATTQSHILNQATRLSAAASRAKHMLCFLVDHTALKEALGVKDRSYLTKLLRWFEEHEGSWCQWPAHTPLDEEPFYKYVATQLRVTPAADQSVKASN